MKKLNKWVGKVDEEGPIRKGWDDDNDIMEDKVDDPLDIVDSVDYHINDISWHQVSGIKNGEYFMK